MFRRLTMSFLRARAGHAAVITAVAAPVLVGAAGLGAETGLWFYKQRVAQMSADVSAYAGAVAARANESDAVIRSVAEEEAVNHGFDPALGTIQINHPPVTGPNQNERSVEVVMVQNHPRLLSALFLNNDVTMTVRSVASFQEPGPACILALDTSASKALIFTGSSSATLTNCDLMSNSLADDALSVEGSGTVTATCANSVGGVNVTANLNLTDCPEPRIHMPRAPDPYEDLDPPPIPNGCRNVPGGNPHQTTTIQPGHYCNGLSLNGNIEMSPGVYVVSGDVTTNGNAHVVGDGVTIYVRNNGRVRMNGNAFVDLAPPETGDYAGVLFYGDRNNSADTEVLFNGTADSSLVGALYFPNQTVEMRGDFNGSGGCTRIISRLVDVSGNTDFSSDCSVPGVDTIAVPGLVTLME